LAKRRSKHGPSGSKGPPRTGRSATLLRVRKVAGEDAWEFVPPRCAVDRAEDLEEVRKMIEADELDIAIDELRWLLNGCSDFVDAHKTLGELALLEPDIPLARGHFGYGYQLGTKAMQVAGCRGLLPYRIPANQAFHEAGKGLAFCLKQQGKQAMLADVVQTLLRCDPSDPLGVRGFLGDSTADPKGAPPAR
jgi:hypothetical protein